MDFIVGSFNHDLYTLHFIPPTKDQAASLSIVRSTPAIAGHSWLCFSKDKKHLYATAWTKPKPSAAAYSLQDAGRDIQFINAKHVNALAGYICCSETHLYTVGGPTGEVFRLEADGAIGELVQELDFVDPEGNNQSEDRGNVPHGSFGGLRHGAHSCDLSPDGQSLYVADIGRNCIWTFSINPATLRDRNNTEPNLKLRSKHISPRTHDGPRHTWPHPNGKILYSLQEHSSMVDIFSVASDGVSLQHKQGVKIIPEDKDCKHYWADEVRLSTGPDKMKPKYMYASTRGLKAETRGYVAVFRLREDGMLDSEQPLDIWETPTSGGIANAIEPAPYDTSHGDEEYLAMTDSEEGWVFILSFDGHKIREVTRVNLGKTDEGDVVQAATALWLGEGGLKDKLQMASGH